MFKALLEKSGIAWLLPLATFTALMACNRGPEAGTGVTPFTNVAPDVLQDGHQVWNDRPGVVIFDYNRDGRLDFYITSAEGHANYLWRNNGDGSFTNVAEEARVAATGSNSSGAVACDIDNDGYQDLYVGAWGRHGDGLDFRSALGQDESARQLREAVKDRLFLNNGDGTFTDITDSAFGDAANIRSAMSIACADVDRDGWLDIYVGNAGDPDFMMFDSPNHPGNYNALYRNNGDRTFTELAEQAGVRGPQITLRDPSGQPILFQDPQTGETYEGYDPTFKDALGNRVGDPTGQTHAVLFFDHDDDGDHDLWAASDGDRLRVFRNDSVPGNISFTSVEQEMGIAQVGAWMGFAVGDYDSDSRLDLFVANVGFHPRLVPPKDRPSGSCEYNDQFDWGTCLHYLLRNEGPGSPQMFRDVASSTTVKPSALMPPASLDPANIYPPHEAPAGLAAYDFGFGATFFDCDNDGDQDLYWLGSIARGEGPGGQVFPSAGRMMRGDGKGSFEDITVEARLLDIARVNYADLGNDSLPPIARRIHPRYHENGKGVAHGDLNGDGYVDLIATNSSGDLFTESPEARSEATLTSKPAPGPVFVWLNGGGVNHWLTIRLQGRMAVDGTGSNADGIGAKVFLKTRSGVQVQEARAGSSYLSMDSADLEFGLGATKTVDEITIRWPSGRTQTLKKIAADQVLVVTEPES